MASLTFGLRHHQCNAGVHHVRRAGQGCQHPLRIVGICWLLQDSILVLNDLQVSLGAELHAGCKNSCRRVLQVQHSCTGESRASFRNLL